MKRRMMTGIMSRIHHKIREVLEASPGLTQKGLAERMGLNPAAVNRMLYGRRNIMAEEIPIIEDYLGIRLPLSDIEYRQDSQAVPQQQRRGFGEAGRQEPLHDPVSMVPVYGPGLAKAGAVDWALRHPAQTGIRDAFAIYVPDDTMAPRYFRGELAYIHPGRPAEQGRDCLVVMKNDAFHLAHLLDQDGKGPKLRQYNPAQDKTQRQDTIAALYAVVGRG